MERSWTTALERKDLLVVAAADVHHQRVSAFSLAGKELVEQERIGLKALRRT